VYHFVLAQTWQNGVFAVVVWQTKSSDSNRRDGTLKTDEIVMTSVSHTNVKETILKVTLRMLSRSITDASRAAAAGANRDRVSAFIEQGCR